MAFGRVSTDARASRRAQSQEEPGAGSTATMVLPQPTASVQNAAKGGVPGVLLGELLVRNGALSTDSLDDTLARQAATGRRLGALLTEMGFVSERDVARDVAEQVSMPMVDLTRIAPDPEVAALLGESRARSLQAIPLSVLEDGRVQVALPDPSPEISEEVIGALGRPALLAVATPSEVRRAIDSTFRALSGVDDHVAAFSATNEVQTTVHRTEVDDSTADGPVVRVVNLIITQALRDRASDIHVEPQDGRVRVRYRIDAEVPADVDELVDIGGRLAGRGGQPRQAQRHTSSRDSTSSAHGAILRSALERMTVCSRGRALSAT